MQKCLHCAESSELRTVRKCKHTFCCKCLVEYFSKFSKEKLKCTIRDCKAIINDQILRECLSNDQIELYEKISVPENENYFKCLTNDCPKITKYEEPLIFECSFCKAPNCISCKIRHYPSERCGFKSSNQKAIESRAREELKQRSRLLFNEFQKKYKLIPNPESFTCPICDEFILPRAGAILRNCLHNVCESCLKETLSSVKFIKQMVCPILKCNQSLDQCEILVILNESKLSRMIRSEASSLFFQCKNADCNGMWDIESGKGLISCEMCNKINCTDCNDIHEGESCKEFRRTDRYISSQDQYKIISDKKAVKCYHCSQLIIQNGGCGAMHCNKCGNLTCLFTGKMPGPHKPEKCKCQGASTCKEIHLYCDCTSAKPCHKNCLYGCFPEDN